MIQYLQIQRRFFAAHGTGIPSTTGTTASAFMTPPFWSPQGRSLKGSRVLRGQFLGGLSMRGSYLEGETGKLWCARDPQHARSSRDSPLEEPPCADLCRSCGSPLSEPRRCDGAMTFPLAFPRLFILKRTWPSSCPPLTRCTNVSFSLLLFMCFYKCRTYRHHTNPLLA